jgi:hypothetical protein
MGQGYKGDEHPAGMTLGMGITSALGSISTEVWPIAGHLMSVRPDNDQSPYESGGNQLDLFNQTRIIIVSPRTIDPLGYRTFLQKIVWSGLQILNTHLPA